MKDNIGIIGTGFVGNAVYQGMKKYFNAFTYDKDPLKNSTVSGIDVIINILLYPFFNNSSAINNNVIVLPDLGLWERQCCNCFKFFLNCINASAWLNLTLRCILPDVFKYSLSIKSYISSISVKF